MKAIISRHTKREEWSIQKFYVAIINFLLTVSVVQVLIQCKW